MQLAEYSSHGRHINIYMGRERLNIKSDALQNLISVGHWGLQDMYQLLSSSTASQSLYCLAVVRHGPLRKKMISCCDVCGSEIHFISCSVTAWLKPPQDAEALSRMPLGNGINYQASAGHKETSLGSELLRIQWKWKLYFSKAAFSWFYFMIKCLMCKWYMSNEGTCVLLRHICLMTLRWRIDCIKRTF